jgi:hypothetical protein
LAFTAPKIETIATFREKLVWKLSRLVTDHLIICIAMMSVDIYERVAANRDAV